MIYAAVADMEARYPNRDLVQLTNDDTTQITVDAAVIAQALADASAEIDGYLAARFALPLADPPAVLNRVACDIAMYRLQALRPLHDIIEARDRYLDAIKMLEKVADGKLTLGLSADNLEPPAASGETVLQGPQDATQAKVFTRDRLRGF